MHYNKLVRDLIPEQIAARGGNAVTHIADEAEYRLKLSEKLVEEAQEFLRDQNIEEVADVLEVVDAILAFHGFDRAEVDRVRAEKAMIKGKFERRIILDES